MRTEKRKLPFPGAICEIDDPRMLECDVIALPCAALRTRFVTESKVPSEFGQMKLRAKPIHNSSFYLTMTKSNLSCRVTADFSSWG